MTPLVTEPSLVEEMDVATYHSDPVKGGSLSYSGMKQLLKSPASYRHYMDQPREPKKVFDAGHIVHSLVLGTPLGVVEIPDSILASNGAASTTAAKEFVAQARLDDLIPVKSHELDPMRDQAEAVLAHPWAGPLFTGEGPVEVSMFAPDPESGVWIRGRADKINTNWNGDVVLADLKTTTDADPAVFNRTAVARLHYYLQAHVYGQLYHWITGEPAPQMLIVAVTKTPPYLVSVNSLDWAYDDLGKETMRVAIDLYKQCAQTNEWPGYDGVRTLTPPAYLMYDDTEEIEI